MAITINGVACEEIVRNYNESADIRSGVASRKGYLCDWTSRYSVARGLLGLTSTTGVGGTVSFTLPSRHPQLYNCYCMSVEFEPVGTPSQGPYQVAWPKCIVWGIYSTANFQWSASPYNNIDPSTPFIYAEQELDVGTEVVTIPGRNLYYSGTIRKVGQSYSFKIGLVDIKITLHQVPYLPGQQIINMAGAINSGTYLGVPAGQLLFNGANNRGVLQSDGSYSQDITYSFTARSQPWDYAYDPVTSTWKKVIRIGGSDFITRQSFVGIMPGDYQTSGFWLPPLITG